MTTLEQLLADQAILIQKIIAEAKNEALNVAAKPKSTIENKQLDLFSFHEEGPGFPFFHSKGKIIFNKLTQNDCLSIYINLIYVRSEINPYCFVHNFTQFTYPSVLCRMCI